MMKKILVTALILLVATILFAQEYPLIKVAEFENRAESSFLYTQEIKPEDMEIGNIIAFDKDGRILIQQMQQREIQIYNEIGQIKASSILKYNAPLLPIKQILNDKIMCSLSIGNTTMIDYDGKILFDVNFYGIVNSSLFPSSYYDEASNILLFTDNQYKLHSIVNPGMDEAQNKANYRNPEETIALFESGTDLQGLTRDEKGRIYKNGKFISGGTNFNPVVNNNYYLLDPRKIWVSDDNNKDLAAITIIQQRNEIHESTAVHPSGDIYLLRYNKETDKHILYKIENTWDLEAKKAWQNR
ncbi:hypothetical protein [Treponema brennaborense]|uniref:Uncharacterized protein n=1 Tax=Treponema brennaborense (strain DSM 12168 / CIP 105900 / DD5/3) TaxID=906968 RepID=F4LM19_TREBD|nr:hypothetical protein [Treponema brennaborense]AEE16698.1 hypothetical protein Trebr_1271 [Treponema brennaborense DSM 12168]